MSLSSLIVQREVATMRQVEEALARQVIYGGDLGTNLLEVARVDEVTLTKLLAESMKLPPAPVGELPIASGRVRALVPPEMAAQRALVPLSIEEERLVLAVSEPMPRDLEEQLVFALGLPIEQRVATAVRVRQAISRIYGMPLERRMQRLVARLAGQTPATGSMPPPLGAVPAMAQTSSGLSTRPSRTGTPTYGTATSSSLVAGAIGTAPRRTKTITGLPMARAVTAPARVQATQPVIAPPRPPESESPPSTPLAGERRVGLLQRDITPSVRPARRRRGPLTLEVARHEAGEAADRDALLDLFFDFSRQFFDYATLFLVHGDIAEGRDSFGVGAPRERVVGIGVPLDLPGMMTTVRDKRTALVAKAPEDGLEAELLSDLQRPRDVELAIVPLVVRTRAVAMLMGDCSDAGIDRAGLQQVVAFATAIGKAFERLIVRRKLDGFIAGSKSTGVGRVDPSMVPIAPKRPSSRPPPRPTPLPARAAHAVPTPTNAPPPPANLAALRPIGGPPIPREEPDSDKVPIVPRLPAMDIRIDPKIEDGPDSKALFDELGWETADDDYSPPPSAAIAVPPHLPPLPRSAAVELPSIIVDIDQELASLVDRILAGLSDESDEAELLRQGERAMPVIMMRFPGPVLFERARISAMAAPPRASECGKLLRLVARQRRVALPFVLQRLTDPDAESRGWATHLLCELPYPEAIKPLLKSLRDSDPATRASAAHALAAIARHHGDEVREAVLGLFRGGDTAARVAAIRAMAQLREPSLVPELVRALGDSDEAVLTAAHDALIQVTCQDFGTDARPWLRWWDANATRQRIEWLIDALTVEVSEIRRMAGEELRGLSKESFGYAADLPARERERVQQRYRDWWITEGRARSRRQGDP
jgi:hypothetical protein